MAWPKPILLCHCFNLSPTVTNTELLWIVTLKSWVIIYSIHFLTGSFSQWKFALSSVKTFILDFMFIFLYYNPIFYYLSDTCTYLSRAEPIVCPIDLIKTILSVSESDWLHIFHPNPALAHPNEHIFICWNSSFQVDRLFYRPGLAFLQSVPAVTPRQRAAPAPATEGQWQSGHFQWEWDWASETFINKEKRLITSSILRILSKTVIVMYRGG